MTASPALLTNERLDRIRADHADNRTYAHYGQRDIGALLQHIAALEQRVAVLERHNGFLRDWCRDPAEVRRIIESALPKELR